jgi:hypothetical protein
MTCSTGAPERLDPDRGLDAVKQAGVVDVRGGRIGQRRAAAIIELDQRWASRTGGDGRVAAPARLKLGLLVSADHEVARVQQPPVETARVEIEHHAGLLGEPGSRGKIHERCCHGFKAALCSQREIVDADASVTARSITSR